MYLRILATILFTVVMLAANTFAAGELRQYESGAQVGNDMPAMAAEGSASFSTQQLKAKTGAPEDQTERQGEAKEKYKSSPDGTGEKKIR